MANGKGDRVWMGEHNLYFDCSSVHRDANLKINFQRTLRIPDNGMTYPLPAGLGKFPILPVHNYAEALPEIMATYGGIMLPMYQSEALWINFTGSYPMAVKIGAGKTNAVTGNGWSSGLDGEQQDYVVVPDQQWLDGFCVSEGIVKQFVAMPLGQGYSAEEQITGEAQFGGIQIQVYPMRSSYYEAYMRKKREQESSWDYIFFNRSCDPRMGLAPGGNIEQVIHEDSHGFDAWDIDASLRCFVHIVNSSEFRRITGLLPPHPPITKRHYAKEQIPWFSLYEKEAKAVAGSRRLSTLKSVFGKSKEFGVPQFDNQTLYPQPVQRIHEKEKGEYSID